MRHLDPITNERIRNWLAVPAVVVGLLMPVFQNVSAKRMARDIVDQAVPHIQQDRNISLRIAGSGGWFSGDKTKYLPVTDGFNASSVMRAMDDVNGPLNMGLTGVDMRIVGPDGTNYLTHGDGVFKPVTNISDLNWN